MTDNRTGASAVPPLRGKSTFVTGSVLLVLGLAAVILGIVVTAGTAKSLAGQQIGTPQTSPTTFTSQLDSSTTYAVYEATDARAGNVQPGDITVTGPSGAVVPVARTGDQVSAVGDGDKRYAEVATFDSGTSGSYTIKVASEGSLVAVAPALSTAAKGLAWIVAIVLGEVLALVGLFLILVVAVQRSSSRSPAGPPTPRPSG
mgnify:CR=1 FL=1